MSPGWQSKALQIALRVEKRIGIWFKICTLLFLSYVNIREDYETRKYDKTQDLYNEFRKSLSTLYCKS